MMMKKAVLGLLMCTFILMLVSGCSEKAVSEEEILNRLEASLQTQGLSVENEGKQSNDALEQVYPYRYIVKADNKNEDVMLVYVLDGNKKIQQAIENQHYTITTLTKFENFSTSNVLVVHFALSGDLEKYQKQIENAVDKIDH